ncbi:tyrosine-type recombinase/integrase, partial [Clostridioides difficile]|uniref:tyrosine-type recombinase/integrase n=1 Tax=Clostridioides difficile TaxID=1496 RepID=UPI001142176E
VRKTTHVKQEILMTELANHAFERIVDRRKNAKARPISVDGYQNCLLLKQDGLPKQETHYQSMLRALVKKYNKTHEDKRPKITPHTFRHTLCTNMANKGRSTNIWQYIMEHKNITMTLGYYAHGSFSAERAEMERL